MQGNPRLRILYLARILLQQTDEEHALTAKQLIAYLESEYNIVADRRSIYEDLHALEESGMDIAVRHGRGGGVCLLSRTFEFAELRLLMDAVQSSRFLSEKKSKELLRKLQTLTSDDQARALAAQMELHQRVKTGNEEIYYNVDTLHHAIRANRQVSFCYFSWNEKKEPVFRRGGEFYTVSPCLLMWEDENYYLVAYDETAGELRHYRVDKMRKMKISDAPRAKDATFGAADAAAYAKKQFGMYRGEEKLVTLRCANRLAGVVIDRFGEDLTFRPADAEHFSVSVRVLLSPLFYSWVLGFGAEMRIVAPAEAVEQIYALVQTVSALYEADVPHDR